MYGHLGYFMTIWYILCSSGVFFPGFGIMYQEKSGNPILKSSTEQSTYTGLQLIESSLKVSDAKKP
jgi:hypothetical protein